MKYNKYIRVLHWLIAILIILVLTSGLTRDFWPKGSGKFLFYWHKSLGITIIFLFIIRIFVKLFSKNPPLPESFSKVEKLAAKLGHVALYVIGIGAPLSGYLFRTGRGKSVGWFNIELPSIIQNNLMAKYAYKMHEPLAWIMFALILGHVLSVVKHYYYKHENLLNRIT